MNKEQAQEIAKVAEQICEEKGIKLEAVLETIEMALAAAYRKDFGNKEKSQNIKVDFDLTTGKIKVYDLKIVMEKPIEEELVEGEATNAAPATLSDKKPGKEKEFGEPAIAAEAVPENEKTAVEEAEQEPRFNPKLNITPEEAQQYKKTAKIGDEIRISLEPPANFGRMAAQTAKQVIIQKIREAERTTLYEEFKSKEGQVVVGTVQRREERMVLVDFGRLTALLPSDEQIPQEKYVPGARLKFYVVSAENTSRGPEVIVSRAHPEIVRQLFGSEIPEVANGGIVIKFIAREAGSRSKVAVESVQPGIDPIGSCVGQRGIRAQTIINELGGEKLDIIEYKKEPAQFISSALSPAKILNVELNEPEKTAQVLVNEDQLSLAIGRNGQNVRLASQLTGWKINLIGNTKQEPEKTAVPDDTKQEGAAETATETATETKKEEVKETINSPEIAVEKPADADKTDGLKDKVEKKKSKKKNGQ